MALYSFTKETKGFTIEVGDSIFTYQGYSSTCNDWTNGIFITIGTNPITRLEINLSTDTVEVDGTPFAGTKEQLRLLLNNTVLFNDAIGGGGSGSIDPTPTEGSTNAVQSGGTYDALGTKQPLDADLTAIAALTTTSFGRSLLTQADAAATRTTIGAGTGNGDALTANPLSQFASTTSAQLAGVISDETGSGSLVFSNAPSFTGTISSGGDINGSGNIRGVADNSVIGVDDANPPRLALIKKAGSVPVLAHGSTTPFKISRSSGSGVDTASSYTDEVTIDSGSVGIGVSPSSRLHLPAGSTTANTAPLQFTTGTNETIARAGVMEYNGTNLFFTRTGTTRENVFVGTKVDGAYITPVTDKALEIVIDGVTYHIQLVTT